MTAQNPPPNQANPIHQVSGPARVFANRLLNVVANLPLKGIERSIKLSPGHFLHERFLVGIAPTYWSEALFVRIYDEMQMPKVMQLQFAVAIARAHFLGLAFELGEHGCVYKSYVEYPVLVRQNGAGDDVSDSASPVLQYQGFKWDPETPDKHTITDYHWRPRLSKAAIAAHCAAHLAAPMLALIPELFQQVLEQAAARADAREFVFLEVGEASSSRKSVDLNVYCAGIAVSEFAEQIRAIALKFGLDAAVVNSVLERDGNQILGHISAGQDRNGADFLTVYFDH